MLNDNEVLLLAGSSEFRLARTLAEVERELARGFWPSVVLLGAGVSDARSRALAERVASRPACSEVPILKLSGDEERLRLTLVNEVGALLSDPPRLEELLRTLEELCFDMQDEGIAWARQLEEREGASRITGWFAEAETAY